MVGGPIGGLIADKILKSPTKYLFYTFIISVIVLVTFIFLPHESMPVYLGMVCTLGFGTIVFTQRAIFFAPIGEANIKESSTGCNGTGQLYRLCPGHVLLQPLRPYSRQLSGHDRLQNRVRPDGIVCLLRRFRFRYSDYQY